MMMMLIVLYVEMMMENHAFLPSLTVPGSICNISTVGNALLAVRSKTLRWAFTGIPAFHPTW